MIQPSMTAALQYSAKALYQLAGFVSGKPVCSSLWKRSQREEVNEGEQCYADPFKWYCLASGAFYVLKPIRPHNGRGRPLCAVLERPPTAAYRTHYSQKSWRITTELNATKFCHTLADTFCNNNSSLHAYVALSEILIFISFVHAISKIFISIFVMIKYGVT